MSDTTPQTPAPPTSDRRGAVIVSVQVVLTFFVALAISGAIAWFRDDKTLLITLCAIIGAKFVTIVDYWVGSSSGSDKKTDLLAQAPPIGTKPP